MATDSMNRRRFLRGTMMGAGVGLLAACGGQAATQNGGAASSGATAPTTSSAAPAAGAAATAAPAAAATAAGAAAVDPLADFKGKLPSPAPGVPDAYTSLPPTYKSSTGVPGLGSRVTALHISYDPPIPGRDQNSFLQELEKRIGLSAYEPTLVPAANYQEKISAVTASGDIADLTFIDLNQAPDQAKALQQGAYADLTPLLSGDALKDYPNLAKFPPQLWKNSSFNGKIYGVPRPRFIGNNALYFRADWAEKVGFAQPKNADDVFKMFEAFSKGDPNGNGSADTYGLSTASPRPDFNVSVWSQMYGAPNGWRLNSDGTLTHTSETEEYKQAIDFARRLWAAGAFHPDATNLTTNQNKELFYGGKIGAYSDGVAGLFGSGGAYGKTREINPDASVTAWVPVGANGGKATYHNQIGFFGMTAISATAGRDPERVKELLRILDYFASPFGSEEQVFLSNGIEGLHHTVEADGRRVKTELGKTEVGTGTLTGQTNAPPVAYYDLPGNAETMQKIQQDLLAIGIDNPAYGAFSATNAAKTGELDQLRADRLLEIVTGRQELSTWDTFLNDWRSRGGDQIRQELVEAIGKK